MVIICHSGDNRILSLKGTVSRQLRKFWNSLSLPALLRASSPCSSGFYHGPFLFLLRNLIYFKALISNSIIIISQVPIFSPNWHMTLTRNSKHQLVINTINSSHSNMNLHPSPMTSVFSCFAN